MKSLLFLVETSKYGNHVLYVHPIQHQFGTYFTLKEEDTEETFSFTKEKIQKFLSQTEYFGLVNLNNILGFTATFISDFFAPSKKGQSQEIFIDDLVFITSSITFKEKSQEDQSHRVTAFNLVIALEKQSPEYILYCKKSIIYLAKVLELEERLSGKLTQHVSRILEKSSEFEKKITQLPAEFEKQKLNLQEIPKKLIDAISLLSESMINQIELYKILKEFYESIENTTEIKINHFVQKLPAPEMILNPIKVDIRPYQTIMIKKKLCQQMLTNLKSIRFEKFLQVLNPILSFEDLSMQYNFPIQEIQVFVTHLLIHQKGIILNKITYENIFTLNPNFKFSLDKSTVKLADQYFNNYKYDFLSVVGLFNKPRKISQIIQEVAGFDRNCILPLISQKVIKECEVYLYLKDPFLTMEKFKLVLKQKIYNNSPVISESHSMSSSQFSQDLLKAVREPFQQQIINPKDDEKTDTILIKHISKYFSQKVSLHEIAWMLSADVALLWKFLRKYEDYLGYYYLE